MPWKESSTLNEREKFVKAMAVWLGEFHIGTHVLKLYPLGSWRHPKSGLR